VAATGFLPGALSFLWALSHLEGVAHKPTSLTQSKTACHNKHRENGYRLPKNQFNSHWMFSRSRFQNRAPRTSSLSFSWENRDSSPKLTWTFRSGNTHASFLSQTDSMDLNKGKHAFFSTQHRIPLCNIHTRGLLQAGSRVEWNARDPPPTAVPLCFICMRQGGHPGNCMCSICMPPCTRLSFLLGT
jgi:hypothetical protein